jgi:hypothetical protein
MKYKGHRVLPDAIMEELDFPKAEVWQFLCIQIDIYKVQCPTSF